MAFKEQYYVVFLHDVPIGVHRWPWMALNEAKERGLASEPCKIAACSINYWLSDSQLVDTFNNEEPTNPDCVPCSHGELCDDNWKSNTSGAV